jgi:hypothetical protein
MVGRVGAARKGTALTRRGRLRIFPPSAIRMGMGFPEIALVEG